MSGVLDGLRRGGRWLWRWQWLITVPIVLYGSSWAFDVGQRYADFGLRYPLLGNESRMLARFARMELEHDLRRAELFFRRDDPRAGGLRQVHLFLGDSEQRSLESRLPLSGRSYVPARLLYPDGAVYDVEARYRGDFWWHWALHKKSLRIKTKRSRLWEGMRRFNLIAPKFPSQLNNYLALRLSTYFDLLAPQVEMVNLWVNGRNRGLHLLAEEIEESTLRRTGRMPGDIYRGELIGRDRYLGISNQLFLHPRVWEKVAVNNHYPEESMAPMEALVELLGEAAFGRADLATLLPIESWGRFLAFELVAQAVHYDATHNWRLYYDPARSRFEPVIWDPNGWHPGKSPPPGTRIWLDIRASPLHDVLLSDHRYLVARQRALEEYFADGRDEAFLDEAEEIARAVVATLPADPGLAFAFAEVGPETSAARVAALVGEIEETQQELRAAYLEPTGALDYSVERREPLVLGLLTDQRVAPRRLVLRFERPLERRVAARVEVRTTAGDQAADVSGAVVHRGDELHIEVPLLPSYVPVSHGRGGGGRLLRRVPGRYRLELHGVDPENVLREILAEDAAGRRQRVVRRESLPPRAFSYATRVIEPAPIVGAERWSGEHLVAEVTRIAGDLVVEAGTTVRMAAGASLIVEGRLVADGSSERPIRFLPARDDQAPWGAVVLRGRGADGSLLRHCEMARGSGYKEPLFEYSAMLSIHDVQGVDVEDCSFRDSTVVDDMIHVVYGDVRFVRSQFRRAAFDAIDLDISTALIEDCRFSDSGNDAIDLMTSRAVVVDTRIERAGDKGISVGEGSELVAVDNAFVGNHIGIESKDGSIAHLVGSTLEDNRLAVNAYRKNWRYGDGGRVRLVRNELRGNGDALRADEHSRIEIVGPVGDMHWSDQPRVEVLPAGGGEEIPAFARTYLRRTGRAARGHDGD